MLRLFLLEENQIEFSEIKNQIDGNLSPFKEILDRSHYGDYSFSINENEVIYFKDIYDLTINLSNYGHFHLFYKKEGFNKDEMIDKVYELKGSEDPLNSLFSLIEDNNPLFILFKSRKGASVNKDEVVNSYNLNIPFLYDEKEEAITEKKKEEEHLSPLQLLVGNKFHFLLLLVSTILFSSSIPLAVLNINANNALWIFLIICSLIGVAMTEYDYYDYFKKGGLKTLFFLLSSIDNLLGLIAGSLVFVIFYNISNKPDPDPGLKHYLIVGILLSLSAIILVIGLTYAFTHFKRKRPEGRL